MHTKIQQIYETSMEVFCYNNSSQQEKLSHFVDILTGEDFNLKEKIGSLSPCSGYITEDIFDSDNFHMGLFMIPKGDIIHLHDHPEMTILMKALHGNMYIKSYDWAEEHPWSGLARLTYEKILHDNSPLEIVLPNYGNIHCIKALTDCAFVDLFSPPYCEMQGRNCSYYREIETVNISNEELVRLEKIT